MTNPTVQPTSVPPRDDRASRPATYNTAGGTIIVPPEAQREFDRAHRRAFIQDALSFLRHGPPDLLSFEMVKERLNLEDKIDRGIQTINLAQVVGSVGRYKDFTRAFLPRTEKVRSRWQHIDQLTAARGVTPIEVYQVGQVYFVVDGNHRVSVARQMGAKTIQAHVWEFPSRVPLEPDDARQDVLARQEYLRFLDHTHLDQQRPEQYVILTSPEGYRHFEERIAIHRHYMELERGSDVSFREAAADWYDRIYCPMVDVIHREDMLHLFPGRTEADLVNWIITNQTHLRDRYGHRRVSTEGLAEKAAERAYGNLWRRFVAWFRRKVLRWPVYTGKPWQP